MMSPRDRQIVVDKLLAAAREAEKIVMRVYGEADFGTELKGPNDPVTRADREANTLLLEHLGHDFPGMPIVAEESDPSTYADFEKERTALFVDPVDGTREFVERNGEFAVMIGVAEDARPTAAVIACPALGATYIGAEGMGAWIIDAGGARSPIRVSTTRTLAESRCAVSRHHLNETAKARLAVLAMKELVRIGSAGIKGVRVATGEVDVFAHPTNGSMNLWDACAPDAIVRAAGGILTDALGQPFDYRGAVSQGRGMLAANPTLHAEAVRRLRRI
ncbi:MAG: 3'(2'),5'-bisphosphate nucleotidase CysQ [Polyangiaceae bacterium]|nr:3'(2'),5'-bisphosphate nucleotidase CysQ [Polyangiaceae bacterium]